MPDWEVGGAALQTFGDGGHIEVGGLGLAAIIEDPVYATAGDLKVGGLALATFGPGGPTGIEVGGLALNAQLKELDVEVEVPNPPLGPPAIVDPPIFYPEPRPTPPPRAPSSYPTPGEDLPDIPTRDEWGPGQVPGFVELAIGSDQWDRAQWTDFTRDLRLIGSQAIKWKRGRPNEHGRTAPSASAVRINATDGALVPDNPASPFHPHWQVGTPARVSTDTGTQGLYLPGSTGSHADTPHQGGHNVTSLDLRARIAADAWNTGIEWSGASFLLDRPQEIATKWGAGGNSWAWAIFNAGWPVLLLWDGVGATGIPAPAVVAALGPAWLGATYHDGTVSHYMWVPQSTPPADITAWELLGTVDAFPQILPSTTPITLGARDNGDLTSFRGRIETVEIRSGINGPLIAAPDFSTAAEDDTTLTDPTGNTWTVHGQAAITARRVRMAGEVTSIAPSWPARDHAAGKAEPTHAQVAIEIAGPLQRIQQGDSPLRGAIHRHIAGKPRQNSVTEYWPMTDGDVTDRFWSTATTGHMTITGDVKTASDSTLIGSEPLPVIEAGKTATIAGGVAGAGTQWAVDWFTRIGGTVEPGDGEPETFTEIFRCATTGGDVIMSVSATTWRVTINGVDNNYGLLADWIDNWLLCRISSDGSTFTWSVIPLDQGVVYGLTLGSGGLLTGVAVHTTGPPGGLTVGHISVSDLPIGWLAGADTAWVGESAAHRVWRLCMEQGVPCEIIGDPDVHGHSLRGDITRSEPMGPQRQAAFIQLVEECVAADGGLLSERRASPGLVYRTRQSMIGQDVQFTVDAAKNYLTTPVAPRLDNERTRNDVTVTSVGGSSARAVDAASIDTAGTYDTAISVVGVGGVEIQAAILAAVDGLAAKVDTQNAERAAWELRLGTVDTMRWPHIGIAVDLIDDPDDLDAFLRLEAGDLIEVVNLPEQHPGAVRLIVQAMTETLTPTRHTAELTCSPAAPWESE